MSKIYEALRQAELDRAKNGQAQSDNGMNATNTSGAVLDTEPTVLGFPESGTFATLASAAKPAGERTFAAALADTKDAGVALVEPVTENSEEIDFDKIRPYVWRPLIQQLPALEERGSSVEQFRSLRSRMQEFRDLNKLKSLLISSGLPQEGKSFIAANLAISFARHKAGRVLLIDGDMRRATLHKLLGCAQGPGLTEYLAGASSILEIMQRPSTDDPAHPVPSGLASLTLFPRATNTIRRQIFPAITASIA